MTISKQEVPRVFRPENAVKLSENPYQTSSPNTQQFLNVKTRRKLLRKSKNTSISFTGIATIYCTKLSTDCTVQPIADWTVCTGAGTVFRTGKAPNVQFWLCNLFPKQHQVFGGRFLPEKRQKCWLLSLACRGRCATYMAFLSPLLRVHVPNMQVRSCILCPKPDLNFYFWILLTKFYVRHLFKQKKHCRHVSGAATEKHNTQTVFLLMIKMSR